MQSSKQKTKHFREGFGEWVRITSDGQFKEKFDKWEKRRSSKKLRRIKKYCNKYITKFIKWTSKRNYCK